MSVFRRPDSGKDFARRWRVLDAIERLAAKFLFPMVTDAVQKERREMVRGLDADGKEDATNKTA